MNNEPLIEDYDTFLGEIGRIDGMLRSEGRVDSRRKISQVLDIMESAKYSIDIVGINALGPVHQGREALIKLLDNGGSARISVLDYKHDVFKERKEQEQDKVGRLISELATTFSILHEISEKNKGIDMNVYFHKFPKAALTIGDMDNEEGQMQVNVYPADVGARGLTGRTYLLKPKDGDAFKAGKDFYLRLLDDSRGIVCHDEPRFVYIPKNRYYMRSMEKIILDEHI